jgi:arylsulfatase A-like enzyme
VTLTGILREQGYRTGGFPANPNLLAKGWSRDFDVYQPPWLVGRHTYISSLNRYLLGSEAAWGIRQDSGRVLSQARTWWHENTSGSRFLFVNLLDPHGPYWPSVEDRERFLPDVDAERAFEVGWDPFKYRAFPPLGSSEARIVGGLYDAEIAGMDRELGRFFDWLAQRGELNDCLVVITSDHGERLGERGRIGHLLDMDQHLLRVPLIVRYPPRIAPERPERLFQLTELPQLILTTAGFEVPISMQIRELAASASASSEGGNIQPSSRAEGDAAESLIFAQHQFFDWYAERLLRKNPAFDLAEYRGNWTFVADTELGLLWSPERPRASAILFDYRTDPDLERNLIDLRPERFERLFTAASRIPAYVPRASAQGANGGGDTDHVDEEIRRRLRALGYVD